MKNLTYKVGGGFLGDKFKATSLSDKVDQLLKIASKLSSEDLVKLKKMKTIKKAGLTYYKEYINALYEQLVSNSRIDEKRTV